MNILLTSGRAPASLELARLLNQSGNQVFIADSFRFHLSKHSAAVKKCFYVSPPRQEKENYLRQINKIIHENNIELLIPVYEESFHISLIKDKIVGCPVFIEGIDKLRKLHNKAEFISYCDSLGLPAPKTNVFHSIEQLKTMNINAREIVLKPCFSRFGEEVIVAPENFDLDIHVSETSPWVAQEKLGGQQYCTYSICHEGRLLSLATYPSDLTQDKVSLNFRHIENKEIESWVRSFVERTSFTGQIGFDFYINERGVFPIECNPRMTSGLHLHADNSKITRCFTAPQEVLELIKPTRDIKNMLGFLVLIYGMTSMKALKTFFASKDIIFRKNDIAPAVDQLVAFFYLVFKSFQKKVSLSKVTTIDIEWNGEAG